MMLLLTVACGFCCFLITGAPAVGNDYDYESFTSGNLSSYEDLFEITTEKPEEDLGSCVIPAISNGSVGRHEKVPGQVYYVFNQFQMGKTLKDGETAILQCNEGFAPQESSKTSRSHSSSEITCENGKWSKSLVCRSVLCVGEPPPIDNGYPVVNHRSHGQVIFYACNKHYLKAKVGKVECYFGMWRGRPPVCADGRCYTKHLNYPGLAKSKLEFVDHLGYIRVVCTIGYKPFRNFMKISCRNGSWIVPEKLCAEVEVPINSTTASTVFVQTSTVDYMTGDSHVVLSNTSSTNLTSEPLNDCLCTYFHRDKNLLAVVNGQAHHYGFQVRKGVSVQLRCQNSSMNLVWQNGACTSKTAHLTCNVCQKWEADSVPSCQASLTDSNIRCTRFSDKQMNLLTVDYEDNDTSVGSRATFSCRKKDQRLSGSSVAVCLKIGEWSSPPPQCTGSCVLAEVLGGMVGQYETISSTWPERVQRVVELQVGKVLKHGETLHLQCKESFYLEGNSTFGVPRFKDEITCENGKWSKPLQCKSGRCSGPLPQVINGKPVNISQEHGAELAFSCDEGFELKGNSAIQCIYGKWADQVPECVEVTSCKPPGNLENGKVTYQSLEFGSELAIKCDDGHRLQQTKPAYCKPDGTWALSDVKCAAIFCNRPKNLKNGKVSYTSLKSESELVFECDEGYFLQQTKPVLCLPNGRWSKSSVICIVVYCDIPENPENGIVHYKSLNFGSKLKFECHEGFQMQQKEPVYCTTNGTWSSKDVTCTAKTCNPPKDPENGKVIFTSVEVGSQLKFKCNDGYLQQPKDKVFCKMDGTWSRTDVKCIAKTCDRPEHPENGQVIITSLDFGSQLNFICDDGYRLQEKGPVYCTSDGTWSRKDVQCVAKSCDFPENPENGQAIFISLNLGSQLKFTCDDGYILHQKGSVYCTSDGSWSRADVECIARTCNHPIHPENGQVMFTSLNFKSQLKFKCDDGYLLQDDEPVYCTADGTWSKMDVQCEAILCKQPQSPENGQVTYSSLEIGSYLKFKCNDGHFLKDTKPVYCTANGTWSKTDVQCDVVSCNFPEHPENGQVSFTSLEFRSELKFRCDDGYHLNTDEPVYCTSDGSWSKVDVECIASICDEPEHPKNGQVAFQSLELGSQLQFRCDEGYHLQPKEPVFCTLDRTWSRTDVRCEVITCEFPEKLKNGQVIAPSLEFGAELEFRCNHGYQLLTKGSVYCTADGTWSKMDVQCEKPCYLQSLLMNLPENVVPESEAFREDADVILIPYHSTVKFKCNDNLHMVSNNPYATCGKNENWEYEEFQCVTGCPMLEKSPESKLKVMPKQTFFRLGESVTFSCPFGLSLTTDIETMMCVRRGWTFETLPECK